MGDGLYASAGRRGEIHLPPIDHAERRQRAVQVLADHGVPALLVTNRTNIRYLTGFSGSNATLIVSDSGHVLATDGRYRTQARAEVSGLGDDLRLVITRDDEWLRDEVLRLSAAFPDAELGVEAEHLTFAQAISMERWDPPVHLRPLRGIIEGLRQRKDPAEQAVLRSACRITAQSFEAMYGWLAPGLTEREVAHRLLGEMIERGADGPSFDFIVAAGRGGAEPHHLAGADRINRGDFVTIDAGAQVDGYHADMTRTVAVGRPDAELAAIYDVVAEAQHRGVAACVAGTAASTVDDTCRDVISDAGHGAHIAHPTGHGVGLDIHEAPILHSSQAATLRAGMAVTVEPGIYVPGLGGVRIEDVVAVTRDGPVTLTTPEDFPPAVPPVHAHPLIEL